MIYITVKRDISLSALDMAEARVEDDEETFRETREAGGARRNPRAPTAASGEVFWWRTSFTFHPHISVYSVCVCVFILLNLKRRKVI